MQGCLDRAVPLCQAVSPNILRVDLWPEDIDYAEAAKAIKTILGAPHEQHLLLRPDLQAEYESADEIHQECRYWSIGAETDCSPLLQKIILADIGGCNALTSNVYFINTAHAVLFHLYDDRGADIVAAEPAPLLPLSQRFNSWILDYDREKIDALFAT